MAALEYLGSLRASHPELSDRCDKLSNLYERKLWHELTIEIEDLIKLSVFQAGDALIELYENFITHFATKINLLKLAHFAVLVSRQYSVDKAISYLDAVIERVQATKVTRIEVAVLYIKTQIAILHLYKGDQKHCKSFLEDGKSTLESMTDIDPSVYAKFYWVSLNYHKHRKEYSQYYQSAMLFLAHNSVESLSDSLKLKIAYGLSLSALMADDIYDFGELFEHPIIKGMRGTNLECLYTFLEAFISGDITRYKKAYVDAIPLLSHPDFGVNKIKFLAKFQVICVLKFISSGAPEDRTIQLSVISKGTGLPVQIIEWVLMKCLSLQLIKGVIDQVEGTVSVTWVKPGFLERSQIKSLRDRLDKWIGKVQTALESVEGADELVAS